MKSHGGVVVSVALALAHASSPNISLYDDVNNVYGRAAYRADSGVVRFLGSFNETALCVRACVEYRDPASADVRCKSFAHHQRDMVDPDPRSYRTLCYGVVDSSFENVSEANVTSGIVHWPASRCAADEDCSLNGVCNVVTGDCQCLAAWGGPSCAVLQLLPTSRTAGLHCPNSTHRVTPLDTPDTSAVSSWGGSVVFDPESGEWQMYAAEMTAGCGIGAWETNSRVVRATSPTFDGEYAVREVIKPTFAHEPMLAGPLRDSGRWLLYSIGNASSSAPARTDCRNGYTPSAGNQNRFPNAVPVEVFISRGTSPAGPWQRATPPGVDVGEGDVNPAPLVLPNGTTVMMWRGGDAWYHVHLARASNWADVPYDLAGTGTGTIFPGLDRHGIEDPFVYVQPPLPGADGGAPTYHAVFHDHSTIGGHAYSRDAINWHYSPITPFGASVRYTDGGNVVLQRRERPHLLFDQRGFIVALSSGVQPPPSAGRGGPPTAAFQNDFTYTLVQPVRAQPDDH